MATPPNTRKRKFNLRDSDLQDNGQVKDLFVKVVQALAFNPCQSLLHRSVVAKMAPESLAFTVHRREPVLVAPAEPTPYEFKKLSDIDDQDGLRIQIPVIQFYRSNRHELSAAKGRDPAKVIKDAIAKALVFYYPFAGRLREGPDRKLMVECTGEGVLFIEADADVCLQQFGEELQPPFPCLEELLYDVEGSGGVLGCPLLLIQVTRLRCGGFIFALRLNHTMSDAPGIVQFMNAVAEMSRGLQVPTVPPVWRRALLDARNPPNPTCIHHEFDRVPDTNATVAALDNSVVLRSFFFGPREISALRKHVPPPPHHLGNCSMFDLLTACLWKSHAVALNHAPDEEVRLICTVSARTKFATPLPAGFYGNAFALPAAVTTAGQLRNRPLSYAIELIREAKSAVTEEYMRSLADALVIRGRQQFTEVRSLAVSDVTRAGFREVDFGWGPAVYGGPADGACSFYVPFKDGIVVPVCLPVPEMCRFEAEIESMVKEKQGSENYNNNDTNNGGNLAPLISKL